MLKKDIYLLHSAGSSVHTPQASTIMGAVNNRQNDFVLVIVISPILKVCPGKFPHLGPFSACINCASDIAIFVFVYLNKFGSQLVEPSLLDQTSHIRTKLL